MLQLLVPPIRLAVLLGSSGSELVGSYDLNIFCYLRKRICAFLYVPNCVEVDFVCALEGLTLRGH